jgi:transposase
MGWYDRKVRRVRDLSCGDTRIFLELEVRRIECHRCGKVKQERLAFLADNPFYTKRFAYYVGQRCRAALFDKFHVIRHLGEALDAVRKSEYGRLQGRRRRYIKGQKCTLLSRRENLSLEGKKALKMLLAANKRLNTAYVLKESFGQLWSYEREGWARRFFENWRASLKWQRLKPYEKFAEMIDRHWEASPPTAGWRTRSRSASSRGSTTRSA